MGFEFKRRESVRQALKRCGQKRSEQASRTLADCARTEAVHEVRKNIKQLRALLRLVRSAMKQSDYKGCSELLREAAGCLAAARDTHVTLSALDGLAGQLESQVSPPSFRVLKNTLATDCHRRQAELCRAHVPEKVDCLLRKFSRELASVELKHSGWRAIGPGLHRSYREGRQGYDLARRSETPRHFHQWRKRAKDLFYQIGLLRRIWPEQMCAAQAELEQLTEYLGNDHDLFLLTEASSLKRFRKKAGPAAAALQALVDARQRELRAQALTLGAKFYEEKASKFCKRLRQYWRKWRRETRVLVGRPGVAS